MRDGSPDPGPDVGDDRSLLFNFSINFVFRKGYRDHSGAGLGSVAAQRETWGLTLLLFYVDSDNTAGRRNWMLGGFLECGSEGWTGPGAAEEVLLPLFAPLNS